MSTKVKNIVMNQSKEPTVSLIQGVVEDSLFDLLKKRKAKDVFISEGRPNLEAAKKLSKQLRERNMTPTLIADNMAGILFYKNFVKEVWISYEVSDKNGALCSIGALILAVLGKKHKVPVYLYPAGIKTKLMGSQKDILNFNGFRTAPSGVRGYVPLMEWVPKKYITKVYSS